jgi:seryl-tRNA synthetase
MLDPRLLRTELTSVIERLKIKKFTLDGDHYESLEQRRKELQITTEALQADRNIRSKSIGQAKAKGEDIEPLLKDVADLGDQLDSQMAALHTLQNELSEIQWSIPNLPDATVPIGDNEDDNEVVRSWGDPTTFSFAVKDHVDLGDQNGHMDFETAGKIRGPGL